MLGSQLRQILIDWHIRTVFDNVDHAIQRAQRRLAHFEKWNMAVSQRIC